MKSKEEVIEQLKHVQESLNPKKNNGLVKEKEIQDKGMRALELIRKKLHEAEEN